MIFKVLVVSGTSYECVVEAKDRGAACARAEAAVSADLEGKETDEFDDVTRYDSDVVTRALSVEKA